jgi:hypothetical protein
MGSRHPAHPDVPIWTAAIDESLDERAFIVPGLGDAGDRAYGTGIIDTTKVVRTALQDAALIAGLLITTEAMVAEVPKKQSPAPVMSGGGMDNIVQDFARTFEIGSSTRHANTIDVGAAKAPHDPEKPNMRLTNNYFGYNVRRLPRRLLR